MLVAEFIVWGMWAACCAVCRGGYQPPACRTARIVYPRETEEQKRTSPNKEGHPVVYSRYPKSICPSRVTALCMRYPPLFSAAMRFIFGRASMAM